MDHNVDPKQKLLDVDLLCSSTRVFGLGVVFGDTKPCVSPKATERRKRAKTLPTESKRARGEKREKTLYRLVLQAGDN